MSVPGPSEVVDLTGPLTPAPGRRLWTWSSPWKPHNGFHRDLEISPPRDSHIPTTDTHFVEDEDNTNTIDGSDPFGTSTGRR